MSDPYDALKLDRQLCFAFYAASRALTSVYREFLDTLGLTYPQYLVLLVLYEENDLTVSQIGAKLMLDSGTLTPLLRRLETMKLVDRVRGTADERTLRIKLTDKAYGLRDQLLNASMEVDCALGMKDGDIHGMRDLVMSLVGKLARDEAGGVPKEE